MFVSIIAEILFFIAASAISEMWLLLMYGEIAKLGAQVKRLTDQVKQDQIKFIYFDEFVNKTDKVYCSVLEFLKVNKNHTPSFENHNPTRAIKFNKLTKIVNQAVGLKKKVGIKLIKLLN